MHGRSKRSSLAMAAALWLSCAPMNGCESDAGGAVDGSVDAASDAAPDSGLTDASPDTGRVDGTGPDTGSPDGGGVTAEEAGGQLLAADRAVYERFPSAIERIASASLPTDDSGLIGRNRQWGALYSPRFQVGAGFALRVALAADDAGAATRAFRAVEAGVEDIEADGRLPSSLPGELGVQPTAADVASAAAFYLHDACPAMLALGAFEGADSIVDADRRQSLTDALGRAVGWLRTQLALLVDADDGAPNRLFHDATAFQACGLLANDADSVMEATSLIDRASAQLDPDGYYVEGGGSDTNYQAAAIRTARATLLSGHTARSASLEAQLAQAAGWLTDRVLPDGRVDSTDNTRTCGGCEVFLPGDPPKQLSPVELVRALAYEGVVQGLPDTLEAVDRFVAWFTGTDPTTTCFELDGADVVEITCP